MKKRVFRERYAKNVVNIETYKEHIEKLEEVKVEKTPTKRGKKNDKPNK